MPNKKAFKHKWTKAKKISDDMDRAREMHGLKKVADRHAERLRSDASYVKRVNN